MWYLFATGLVVSDQTSNISPTLVGNTIHYYDVIMGTMASQITCVMIVYSTDYSDADQRKHISSMSLAFVRGIHRGPVNSPHKCPVTRKMFPFDDVIMCWSLWCSWSIACRCCSNYIFILDVAHGFSGLGKDNRKTRREIFDFWDLLRIIYIRGLIVHRKFGVQCNFLVSLQVRQYSVNMDWTVNTPRKSMCHVLYCWRCDNNKI